MNDTSLDDLARAAGIALTWTDAFNQARTLSRDTLHALLEAMRLPSHELASRRSSLQLLQERERLPPPLITADAGDTFTLPPAMHGAASITLQDEEGRVREWPVDPQGNGQAPTPHGYYTLTLGAQQMTLAVAPKRCFGVSDALGQEKHHAWGLVAQVYSLRRERDGGLGDSRAVAELAAAIGRAGGDAVAFSPLHAISPIKQHFSPYSPSHRGYLNWLHADPAQVLGEAAMNAAIQSADAATAWEHAQQNALVDWPGMYATRRRVFRALYAQRDQLPSRLRDDLAAFAKQGGSPLRDFACFAARQSQAAVRDEALSWKHWGASWQSTDAAAASDFAQQCAEEVEFELFLQWLAARCWDTTRRVASDAGQRIGPIFDLAVGFEAGGGEAWAYREQVLEGLELGAPPDAFNPDGQSWGITSYSPWGLRTSGFRPFIELLRANMARGGGMRIDHIIGLRHLWVLPEGQASTEGGYVQLPLDDLLRLTALESWRHRCIVIGEDLGTVPAGLRDLLAARGVLGIDVLLFTRDGKGDFLPPEQWRANAVATTTTHDLPPLAAWREGADIGHLAQAQHWPDEERQQRTRARANDVERLDAALSAGHADGRPFAYLARTPSPLVLIPVEDALGRKEQPNLPGTVDSHPNWRHRLPADTLDQLQPMMRSLDQSMQGVLPA